jgi:hypothetical protein
MTSIEQMAELLGHPVGEYRGGRFYIARRDLLRLIAMTEDELLDGLSGGARGLELLLGPAQLTGEAFDRPANIWLADVQDVIQMEFWFTAELLRRGGPEPLPWELRSLSRRTGPVVFSRLALCEAMLMITTLVLDPQLQVEHFIAAEPEELRPEDYEDLDFDDEGGDRRCIDPPDLGF